jgi:hypothetical protein
VVNDRIADELAAVGTLRMSGRSGPCDEPGEEFD